MLPGLSFLLTTLLWVPAPGPAQDAKKMAQELLQVFQDRESTAENKRQALERVHGQDALPVAKALVDVHEGLEEEALAADRQRGNRGRGGGPGSGGPGGRGREPARDDPRSLQGRIREQVQAMRQPQTVEWLVDKVVRAHNQGGMVRHAALKAWLGTGLDHVQGATELLDFFDDLEKEALSIEVQRRKAILKGDRGPVGELRRAVDPLRTMQEEVVRSLVDFKDGEAARSILMHLLGSAETPVSLARALIPSLTRRADLGPEPWVKALSRARDPGMQTLLLRAIAHLGKAADAAAPDALRLLSHKDATVRSAAALALSSLAVPESLGPLVARLDVEEGRTLRDVAAALEVLTRQKLGTSVEAWKRWYAAEGNTYTSGLTPLGGGESSLGPSTASGYFHGIPQDGHDIVYVIDVSGSMREPMTSTGRYGRGQPPGPGGGPARIEVCKEELIKALGSLPEDATFNIVYYSDVAALYGKGMMQATPGKIKAAQAWVGDLRADGATNIHDGLEVAFQLAGRGTQDRYYDAAVDTVFLLTDGRPQLPDGTLDSTDRILAAVRRWNPYQSVVVHAIGLGQGINEGFLRALAAQNNGRFVER